MAKGVIPSDNIVFSSDELSKFYSCHRNTWGDLYVSEKWIIDQIASERAGRLGRVLDIGCAAGGLASALGEKHIVEEYLGVEINLQCVESAKSEYADNEKINFIHGDILNLESERNSFHNVFSFSCADWNICTEDIVRQCWSFVKPSGFLIITLRLTLEETILDFGKSFQYIYFGEEFSSNTGACEKAPYVVFNVQDALSLFASLNPKKIVSYGYWGKPSQTAVTPYKELVFAAFAVEKSNLNGNVEPAFECHWPLNLVL